MTGLTFAFIVIFVISYLIGSIPTGWIIVKLLKNQDIRQTGSGSTGATNVKRVLGTKWFFIVMLLDALKGFLPVWFILGHYNFSSFADPDTGAYIDMRGLSPVTAALGVIIGHSKSVFLGFTGGKSVAAGAGTLIALYPPAGWIIAVIWGIITFSTKYVSAGSITAMALAPVLMSAFGQSDYYVIYAALCASLIVITHKDNIKRLIEGTENKIGSSKMQTPKLQPGLNSQKSGLKGYNGKIQRF